MNAIKFHSPKTIDQNVDKLLSRIGSKHAPVILKITPEKYATPANCFFNIPKKIKRDGGSVCYGWAVLIGQGLCEAEAHAVWRGNDDNLVDITPRNADFISDSIMFVEDPRLVFKGRLIDNIRLNMTGDPLFDDFIKVQETIMETKMFCTEVFDGKQLMSGSIVPVLELLYKHSNGLVKLISDGGNMSSPCFCGSRWGYASCHGSGINDGMELLKRKAAELYYNSEEKK